MSTEKRYSVFISSTFEDLREERQAVQDAVLSAGDFPVQMETFPAADEDQFEFIKSLIDKCDFYVLIVAGRYGTPDSDGKSYTEKEYLYAKYKDIPVLVMLHGDPDNIVASRTEATDFGKKHLARFKREISKGRLLKKWSNAGELKHAVRDALDNAKATRPGVGWVRGDTTASADLLNELNEVRKENKAYRDAIGQLETELSLPPVPSADEAIEFELLPRNSGSSFKFSVTRARIKCTWKDAFPIFHGAFEYGLVEWDGQLHYEIDKDQLCIAIGSAFAAELATFDVANLYRISLGTFERLMAYYIEVGFMFEPGQESPFTKAGERAARRLHIANGGRAALSVMEGELAEVDDDIPF